MAQAQLHHYVPRFLLRRFADPTNGRVFVFNKRTDASFLASPERIAAENGLYECEFKGVKMSLEPSLAELDSRAANQIARIVREERLDIGDMKQREELARFLAVQFVRTRAHRVMAEDLFSRMAEYLRREGMDESFFEPDDILRTAENARNAHRIRLISQAPVHLAPALLEKDWLLLRTDVQHPFVLGDHPATMHNGIDRGPRGNLGVNVTGIEIYFPLSPKFAIALFCHSHWNEMAERMAQIDEAACVLPQVAAKRDQALEPAMELQKAFESGQPFGSLSENVDFFNSLQISSAEQFVYSNRSNFGLAKDMVRANAELRHGRRMEEASGAF